MNNNHHYLTFLLIFTKTITTALRILSPSKKNDYFIKKKSGRNSECVFLILTIYVIEEGDVEFV